MCRCIHKFAYSHELLLMIAMLMFVGPARLPSARLFLCVVGSRTRRVAAAPALRSRCSRASIWPSFASHARCRYRQFQFGSTSAIRTALGPLVSVWYLQVASVCLSKHLLHSHSLSYYLTSVHKTARGPIQHSINCQPLPCYGLARRSSKH